MAVDETQPHITPQDQTVPDRETVRRLRAQLEQLREAMESRAVIEQAKGALIARQRCGPEAAFAELVRRSQLDKVKLRDVATAIVRDLVD
jgi:AmiR/NasT family two-component response regulator